MRICSFSSSWALVSTQLFVSSAWRLAHSPRPNVVQNRVPSTSSTATPIDRLRMPAFFEPRG